MTHDPCHELLFLGTVSRVYEDCKIRVLKHDKEKLTTLYAGKVRLRFSLSNNLNILVPTCQGEMAKYHIIEEFPGEFIAMYWNDTTVYPVVGCQVFLAIQEEKNGTTDSQ